MKKTTLASKKNRVIICSMKDIITDHGQMRLYRKGIIEGWAKITLKKASRFSRDGYTVDQSSSAITHKICMSYNPDILISEAAWIYDRRLKSAPRWFKIINVYDDSYNWYFECQIRENSDDAVNPVEKMPDTDMPQPLPLPEGVQL